MVLIRGNTETFRQQCVDRADERSPMITTTLLNRWILPTLLFGVALLSVGCGSGSTSSNVTSSSGSSSSSGSTGSSGSSISPQPSNIVVTVTPTSATMDQNQKTMI